MIRERIVFAPNANETELTRSLSKNGINTFGFRVVDAATLADMMLTYSGVVYPKTLISYREQVSIILSFLNEIEYFASASFADAENIAASLNGLRMLIENDEENRIEIILSDGEFPKKNKAFLELYKRYTTACENKQLGDVVDVIRFAISNTSLLDFEIETLKEFPLQPLEKELLRHASSSSKELTLPKLFNTESKETKVESITAAYGASNEVEDIIGRILEEKIPLDKCTVAVTDPRKYSHLFLNMSERYDIPMTFGCGISIMNTNPARLLKVLYKWNTEGNCGVDALRELINNPAFDFHTLVEKSGLENDIEVKNRAIQIAGNMRLGFDKNRNVTTLAKYNDSLPETFVDEKDSRRKDKEILKSLAIIFDEIAKGYVYLISNYSVIRFGEYGVLDKAGIKAICDSINAINMYSSNNEISVEDIIPNILMKSVCSESSKEGSLHICTLNNALSAIRDNLFIAGLSADVFPGKPVENYLLLDSDYEGLNSAPTSAAIIGRNVELFNNVMDCYSSLGKRIFLSYSSFDLVNLKKINMSSVIYKMANTVTINTADYFNRHFSLSSVVGKEYKSGKTAKGCELKELSESVLYDLEKSYSPSAIDTYFSCPRQFFLKYVLKIDEPDEDNPFDVINSRDFGTVAHRVLEAIRPDIEKGELLKYAKQEIEDFFLYRTPIVSDAATDKINEFLDVISNGLEQDKGNKNADELSEHDIEAPHETGLTLHGFPDKVELLPDGKLVVVDFKTGRLVQHKENDVESCLQALIYAFLLEKRGYTIDHVEYRYPRVGKIISCDYSEENKEKLNQLLEEFMDSLKNGRYEPTTNCKEESPYCKYGSICEKHCINEQRSKDSK